VVAVLIALALAAPAITNAVGNPPPPPAFRPPTSATPVPVAALVPHPNPGLGYSISVPPTYRRAGSSVDAAHTGGDLYTPRTAPQDVDLCRQESQNQSQAAERVDDLRVTVYANQAGTSPVDFANEPVRRLVFTTTQSTTINGLSAARAVQQASGDTAFYVIAANGRLYEITPAVIAQPTTQPHGWLDGIVSTFRVVPLADGIVRQDPCNG
jgi:hypothetical protein